MGRRDLCFVTGEHGGVGKVHLQFYFEMYAVHFTVLTVEVVLTVETAPRTLASPEEDGLRRLL